MSASKAVVFDLGGTLMDPDLAAGAKAFWGRSFDHLTMSLPEDTGPLRYEREAFVGAMMQAEEEHWRKVNEDYWSGPASQLVEEGLCRLGVPAPREKAIQATLDGCARAVPGWAVSGHENLPIDGQESARSWPRKVPTDGHHNCPLQ